MKRHGGFTFHQMLIAMVIMAILAGVGFNAYSKNISRANIDQTSSNLQIMAGNMEDATTDIGFVSVIQGDEGASTDVHHYFNELEDIYFTHTWNYESLVFQVFDTSLHGFVVETALGRDAWGMPFHFYCIYQDDVVQNMIFSSAGPNMVWSDASHTAYQVGDYDDDIFIVMTRRNTP